LHQLLRRPPKEFVFVGGDRVSAELFDEVERSFQGNSIDIDLSEAGHYLVMYSVPTVSTGGSNRSEMQSWLRINDDTNLPGGYGQAYIRRADNANEGYNAGATILQVGAGDDIRVQIQRTDDNTATVARTADKSGISFLRLDDAWDYIRSRPASNQTFGSGTTFESLTLDYDDELDTGSYPAQLDDLVQRESPSDLDPGSQWNGPYLKRGLPKDPWGREYQFKRDSQHNLDYDLWSLGRDGQPGGDDVTNWEQQS